MIMLRLLFLTLLLACGNPGQDSPSSGNLPLEQLISLRNHTLERIGAKQDEHGFIGSTHCDSLLFSGLAAYGGAKVALSVAQRNPGEWFRRPSQDCWEKGESRSTISRDMLLGVMWAYQDDLQTLQDLWDWGDANSWFMGEGRLGGADTLFPPAYISLLAELLLTNGHNTSEIRLWAAYPNNVDGNCEAYVCHVNVLRHYLRAKISKEQPDYKNLRKISDRYPDNPLFAWVAGRKKYAMELLISHYQNGPLCEFYPMQENGGSNNWAKCEDGDSTGAGFLFASQLMLEEAQ